MHQQSRHPPSTFSPASAPQTNPLRSNNPREAPASASRPKPGSDAAGQEAMSATSGESGPAGPSKESVKKLDQIIQNFYTKAAVLILQARIDATPSAAARRGEGSRKMNKWFQIDTDDIDDFRDDLRVWKTCGSLENRPPPMVIETYLDASRLSSSQTLVVIDDNGKRWDALEALNSSDTSSDSSPGGGSQRQAEIVLERWRVELKATATDDLDEFGPVLPTIYKKSIVFFRSLFVTTRILPAWRYSQQALAKSVHPLLEVRCRFLSAEPEFRGYDPLRTPLTDMRDVVTDYVFGDLEIPVGRFSASVSYRNECNFRVDDAESLLSSHFMGVDENFFKPSLPQRRDATKLPYTEVGSLPSEHRARGAQEPQQTYGSLSTFHGAGALGTSPISALKAIRPIGSDTSSPPVSRPASIEHDAPHSLPVGATSGSGRPTLRNFEGSGRRPSVSFQPFKAGSLSQSPRFSEADVPPSPQSLSRGFGAAITQPRNRSSLTAGMAASLRGGPVAPAPVDPGSTPPPKPAGTSRYSSSFQHRRARPSFGGTSRAGDDEQSSSGKQSLASSAQPGSGLLAEGAGTGGGGSSGSLQTDDDNISDFLKILDSKRTLPSFDPNHRAGESAARRTAAQLSKFQLMKETNNQLTDSMTSSMHLHRSSSSSSRQLANVPSMVNPTSMSASSSPGKPLSPHTPHTPAIPSRLSENSIIEYQADAQTARRRGDRGPPEIIATEEEAEDRDGTQPTERQEGTTAIDIPLSPRLLHTATARRSSSVAQQRHATAGLEDDDMDSAYPEHRSISLGADEREPPTRSTLLGRTPAATGGGNARSASASRSPPSLQPAADIRTSSGHGASSIPNADDKTSSGSVLSTTPYRLRYAPRGRATPPQSARGSFSGVRHGSLTRGGGGDEGDDEELLFQLSEIDRVSGRRSIEEARRNTGSGTGEPGTNSERSERGGYEPSRGSRRW